MTTVLKLLLLPFGVVCFLIGSGIAIFGAQCIADFFVGLIAVFNPGVPALGGLSDANTDSELRFYSAIFAGFGLTIIWIALNLTHRLHLVPYPALLFFAGGVARALSVVQNGWPHPFFTALLVVELVLPASILVFWYVARRERS